MKIQQILLDWRWPECVHFKASLLESCGEKRATTTKAQTKAGIVATLPPVKGD